MPPPVGSTFICQVVNDESHSGGRVLGAGGNSDLAGGAHSTAGNPDSSFLLRLSAIGGWGQEGL